LARVAEVIRLHPEAHLRVYRTPAGLRVLAMHRTFDPEDPAVAEFFAVLGTDPLYVRMCKHQKCFRARVSPKPWRIGIKTHLVPRPGVWPVKPEWLPKRKEWVEAYEARALSHASCRLLETVGSPQVTPETQSVQRLHDELCRAISDLPLG
jgi:hypothetical protein